jgi:exonuclease VII small subunit
MSDTSKTLQQKMDELAEAIAWFDSDKFALDEAITKFKEAEALADAVDTDLSSLKNEIIVLKQKFDSEA